MANEEKQWTCQGDESMNLFIEKIETKEFETKKNETKTANAKITKIETIETKTTKIETEIKICPSLGVCTQLKHDFNNEQSKFHCNESFEFVPS